MHEHLSLFYTLIGSLSDDPEFARPDIGYYISLIRCWWARTLREESGVSHVGYRYSYLSYIPIIFLFSMH